MNDISPDIESLIGKVSRLPGLGPRSARRLVLHLLRNKEKALEPLLISLRVVCDKVRTCPECGNLDVFETKCHICNDAKRKTDTICVVENVADVWAIERSRCFAGKYHILHGLLSSINGISPDTLGLDKLVKRCAENSVSEIILALSATLDGQTTDQYIRTYLQSLESCANIKLTSLAVGIPIGGELDFLDDGTLFTAFNFRK